MNVKPGTPKVFSDCWLWSFQLSKVWCGCHQVVAAITYLCLQHGLALG